MNTTHEIVMTAAEADAFQQQFKDAVVVFEDILQQVAFSQRVDLLGSFIARLALRAEHDVLTPLSFVALVNIKANATLKQGVPFQ